MKKKGPSTKETVAQDEFFYALAEYILGVTGTKEEAYAILPLIGDLLEADCGADQAGCVQLEFIS